MTPASTANNGRIGATRRQRGLTLVEVMIAMVIGLVLTAGAIQIFVSSKQGYRTNEAMARIQENGRYALNFIKRDVRSAGFYGCAQKVEVNDTTTGASIDFGGEPVEGAEGGAGVADTLTLRLAEQGSGLQVTQVMPTTAANLFLTSTDGLTEGDVVIVTDCQSADIFMVSNNNKLNDNVAHNTGVAYNGVQNATTNFSKAYSTDAIGFVMREKSYQINNNGLERTVNGVNERLVDDIIDLQLSYGVDFNSNEVPDAYLQGDVLPDNDGDGNPDWGEVLSVRISLLARSEEDNIVDAPQTQVWDFDGDGALDAAPDRRMYQQFTTTVGLRNRLP